MIFYTDEEAATLRTAVYGAMVLVSDAEPGPVVEERYAGLRALKHLSQDLRQVIGAKRVHLPAAGELEPVVLDALRRSVKVLSTKAPEEAFTEAVLEICREVAEADGHVADTESAVFAKIEAALTA